MSTGDARLRFDEAIRLHLLAPQPALDLESLYGDDDRARVADLDAVIVAPRFGMIVHLRRYLHDALVHAFGFRIDGGHVAERRAAGAGLP